MLPHGEKLGGTENLRAPYVPHSPLSPLGAPTDVSSRRLPRVDYSGLARWCAEKPPLRWGQAWAACRGRSRAKIPTTGRSRSRRTAATAA